MGFKTSLPVSSSTSLADASLNAIHKLMKSFWRKINITRSITFNIARLKDNVMKVARRRSGQAASTLRLMSSYWLKWSTQCFMHLLISSYYSGKKVLNLRHSIYYDLIIQSPVIWYLRVLKIAGQGSAGEVTDAGKKGLISVGAGRIAPRAFQTS